MPQPMDGGEALLEALRSAGVEQIFSSPGSEWAPVWEALARQRRDGTPGPTYHDLAHETVAVGMALGYALISGRLAAVLLHTVPGLLQGAVAVHGALLAQAPMLVLSSESVSYGEGTGPDPGGQWYRNLSNVGGPQAVAAPWVKWSDQAATTAILYEHVRRAAEIAQRPPYGPVYVNVPVETLLAPWDPPPVRKPLAPRGTRTSDPAEVEALATRLVAARRPVVIAESAGRESDGFAALVELCELLAIPVIEPPSAICPNFPKDHPLHLGGDVADAAGADLVLLVNARAPWYPPSDSPVPDAYIAVLDEVPQRPHFSYQVLHADCYLEGDVPATLHALAEAAGRLGLDSAEIDARRAQQTGRHEVLASAIAAEEEKASAAVDKVVVEQLVIALREKLGDDALVVDETITHTRALQRHLRWNRPDGWLYVQGGLGQGMAVALGAKLAAPDRTVVLAVGDGSFIYNPVVASLMASRAMNLPLLIVIFNNRQYLSMKLNHLRSYPEGAAVAQNDFDGVDLSSQPPLSELAAPFGMSAFEVSTPAELDHALQAGLASVAAGTTAIVNVSLAR